MAEDASKLLTGIWRQESLAIGIYHLAFSGHGALSLAIHCHVDFPFGFAMFGKDDSQECTWWQLLHTKRLI